MNHHHEHGSGSCKQIFEKLSEYMDGELPSDLCERIDDHMADCPPCQSFMESLRRTVTLHPTPVSLVLCSFSPRAVRR